ncbi:hypothetical protein TCAL_01295 [Tigriopus californicus]|uniref:EGF-like domain-containing protein n=1 Tax=Tigriopus californicus TaxID=6832 RepID=A0A553PDM4_TIGCA|nr:uncharacterized protein LOC131893245 [Tigriopus californicus]TRY75788.1 hypothetical protein TCAL_01295 [Tigriopus californicus]|eukprot:TCALIF_01295-PA protein Name:"Protein of unknown function" AED:0.00 eAED:0.00 QI:92/1/1/1/1/1/3/722/597
MGLQFLGLVAFTFFVGQTMAFDCTQVNSTIMNYNPLGTCNCTGHLYVSNDCREGFYCFDLEGNGCLRTCEEDEFLVPNFKERTWHCLKNGLVPPPDHRELDDEFDPDVFESLSYEDRILLRCPVSGYNLCPSNETAPPPNPDDVTENPLGTCRCNGELWVAEGCSFGFYCNDSIPDIGGTLKICDDGYVLIVDFENNDWDCVEDEGQCPLDQVNGVGCRQPDCLYGQNSLGQCECDGQLYIDEDCNEGFLCSTNIPDPYLFQGCKKTCLNGQILVPDIPNKDWKCEDKSTTQYRCPGAFHFECHANVLGSNFTSDMCGCDGELLVNHDCSEAFYCFGRMANGGRSIKCPEGQIVEVDTDNFDAVCTTNVDKCPGLGGFRVGCDGSDIAVPELPKCEYGPNEIGTCDGCSGQIMVNENCTKSFYCSNWVPDVDDDGCHLECYNGQVVLLDLKTKSWRCDDKPEGFICPGEFKVDCPRAENYAIHCGCQNEVWISDGCRQAFVCVEETIDGAPQGKLTRCNDNEIISFSYANSSLECIPDEGQCPGSVHFGCVGGDLSGTTIPTTTTTTTTTSTENGGDFVKGCFLLVTVLALLGVYQI